MISQISRRFSQSISRQLRSKLISISPSIHVIPCRYLCDGVESGKSSSSSSSSSTKRLKIKRIDNSTGGSLCSSSDDKSDATKPKKDDDEDDDDDDFTGKGANSELDSEKAQKRAIYATKVGAAANIGLALSKGVIGFAVASTALIADAANSLGDVLCDGVVYYTVTEARKRATPDSPWGRGKIEPLGALSVGGLLLATGVGIGYSAFQAGLEVLQVSSITDLLVLANPPDSQSAFLPKIEE